MDWRKCYFRGKNLFYLPIGLFAKKESAKCAAVSRASVLKSKKKCSGEFLLSLCALMFILRPFSDILRVNLCLPFSQLIGLELFDSWDLIGSFLITWWVWLTLAKSSEVSWRNLIDCGHSLGSFSAFYAILMKKFRSTNQPSIIFDVVSKKKQVLKIMWKQFSTWKSWSLCCLSAQRDWGLVFETPKL